MIHQVHLRIQDPVARLPDRIPEVEDFRRRQTGLGRRERRYLEPFLLTGLLADNWPTGDSAIR